MNTSSHWLADFLDRVPPAQQAGDTLTMGGYPVENFSQHTFADGTVDDVLDVEVTSNRPDLLNHVGVARELAALSGLSFNNPHESLDAGQPDLGGVRIEIEDESLCPFFTIRLIKNVKVGPSPQWMQDRLTAIGLRPISNVVDITNYVLHELGQPLHAYDADTVARTDGDSHFIIRNAAAGETLKTLDGQERKLDSNMLLIADPSGPIGMAGVMGGFDTEVTEKTTNILLESARFDPLSIRNTSRKLKLMSDASYRFERGLDPTLQHRASLRAAQLIAELAGGTIVEGYAFAGTEGHTAQKLRVRFSELRRLLGIDLPRDEVVAAYDKLGLSPAADDEGITCTVPSHRLDLSIEADLVEEAIRVIGYDRIPQQDAITITVQPRQPERVALDTLRDLLVAGGYCESITFSFVSDAMKEKFVPAGCKLRRVDANVRKADGHLRPGLLPGLCESLRTNETVGNGSVHLFETGSAFFRDESGQAVEHSRLAFVGGESYPAARGMLETLLAKLDPEKSVTIEPADHVGFGRGACGRITWGGDTIGHLGLLDQAIADALDLRHVPAICELSLEPLIAGHVAIPTNKPLSRFPAVSRDVSLVVSEDVKYADLAGLVESLDLAHLEQVAHATTYRGKPLSKGQKSVTLTLTFRSGEGTLTREDADTQMAKVLGAAKQKYAADVRN